VHFSPSHPQRRGLNGAVRGQQGVKAGGTPDCASLGNDIQFSIKNYSLMKFSSIAVSRVFWGFYFFLVMAGGFSSS